MQDNIELRVVANDPSKAKDVMTQLNLTPSTVRIKGSLITCDGDTRVTKTFFTNGLQAKWITADKLDVDKLSSITANFGEFTTTVSKKGYMKITGSLIEVYDSNNNLRVRLGIW